MTKQEDVQDEKIIYITDGEEIASAVSKLFETKEKKAIFVFPSKSRILSNPVNLKLLKREAASMGKEIYMFNSDPHMKDIAASAQIPLYGAKQMGDEHQMAFPQKPFKVADIVRPKKVIAAKESGGEKKTFKSVEVLPQEQPRAAEEKEEEFFIEEPFVHEEETADDRREPAVHEEESRIFAEDTGSGVFTDDGQDESPDAEEEAEGRGREKTQRFFDAFHQKKTSVTHTRKKTSVKTMLVIFAGFAMAVFFVALYFISASIKIEITPKKKLVDFDIRIDGKQGSGEIDFAASTIPVQHFEIEKNDVREFSTSQKKMVEEKAHGDISIFNAYSSSPQTLVATTRFISKDGKIFRLAKTTTVPGAKIENGKIISSSTTAAVIADQAGEEYNIGPTEFKIPGFEGSPKHDSFYGVSEVAMSGGAKGEKGYVTAEDIESARKTVVDTLMSAAELELAASVSEDYKLLPEAKRMVIADFSTSLQEGEIGDKFAASAEVTLEGIMFKISDINAVIEHSLKERASRESEINWSKQVLSYKDVAPNFSGKSIKLLISGNIETREVVDTEQLAAEIAGKNIEDLKALLYKNNSIAESRITLRPKWLRTVPKNKAKIEITINK